jgi:hypothetical protein
MKYKLLIVAAIICFALTGCKQKRTEVTMEQFEEHPTWTDSNPDAFWE